MNVHRNGMKKYVHFSTMTIIDYCINARINLFITVFDPSSLLEDPSSSFVGATVEPPILATVVFFRPVLRRFVVGFSPLGTPIEPPAGFDNPSFTGGFDAVASLAGRAGVTPLTFDTIHPE
jgi:hypothetical protein